MKLDPDHNGEMAEWLKALASKASLGETLTRVRIPLSPHLFFGLYPSKYEVLNCILILSGTKLFTSKERAPSMIKIKQLLAAILFLIALPAHSALAAGTTYHAPISPTGTPVNAYANAGGNESGTAWYAAGGVWIGCSQNSGYFAFNPDGTLAGSGANHGICTTGNCGNCNGGDCEGLAIVDDTLFCIGESSGDMASYNLADWRANNYDNNGLDRLHTYDTSTLLGSNNLEALATVPYTCTGCEGNVAFILGTQVGSAFVFTLSNTGADPRGITNVNPTPSKFYPPCANYITCPDWSGLDYDQTQKYLYWSSDGFSGCSARGGLCIASLPTCSENSSKTCFKDADCLGTCTATSQIAELDLSTHASNDGAYESLAVCPGCGYVLGAYDGTAFRTYMDSYCGNGLVSSVETCDDGNQTANDGCSAVCDTEAHWSCNGAPSVCINSFRRRVMITN